MKSMKDFFLALIVTIIGGVIVAFLIQEGARFQPPDSPIGQTPPVVPTQQLATALTDNFDGASGSYNTNLWDCSHECGIENVVVKDGVLSLQRSSDGWTNLVSRSKWIYRDLLSLTGNFQIRSNSNPNVSGWLSFDEDVAGCGFLGTQSPYVQCQVNRDEYQSEQFPITFDTWHSIKYQFDQNSNTIRFYIDNNLIGEYTRTTYPETVRVIAGIYSPDIGQVYIDNVVLMLNR